MISFIIKKLKPYRIIEGEKSKVLSTSAQFTFFQGADFGDSLENVIVICFFQS